MIDPSAVAYCSSLNYSDHVRLVWISVKVLEVPKSLRIQNKNSSIKKYSYCVTST